MTQSLTPIKANELQNASAYSADTSILALTDSVNNTVQLLQKATLINSLISLTADNAISISDGGLFAPDYSTEITNIQTLIANLPTIQDIVTVSGGAVNLVSDKVLYSSTPTGSTTYTFTLPSGTVTASQAFTFELYIDMSSTAYSLTFPNTLTWQGGTAPDLSITGKYFLAFRTMDGGSTWLGNLQGAW